MPRVRSGRENLTGLQKRPKKKRRVFRVVPAPVVKYPHFDWRVTVRLFNADIPRVVLAPNHIAVPHGVFAADQENVGSMSVPVIMYMTRGMVSLVATDFFYKKFRGQRGITKGASLFQR